jgi:myo-inositol 2-dehydrogenase/D-chiro-inositol 1-dehydrogenase
MLKIGILGCGRIGVMHAANIAAHPRAALAGLYDVNGGAAEALGAQLGAKVFRTAEAMLASPDVDAVLIATSTPTHCDYIEMALAAGKAVLCEKPIDLDLQRVNTCHDRIAGNTLPVMLAFVRRFDAGHRAARQSLLDGEIGELHQVIITSRDPGMASDIYTESSGGIFRDMTIHDFDLARYMLGEEVDTVTATGSRLVNPPLMDRLGDYDTVSITMTTASGKQAIILNSRRAVYGYDQRVELFGSKGMVISENRRAHHMTRHLAHATNMAAPLLDFFIERYADAFNAEIDSFIDAVEGTAPVEVGFEDGRLALVLADAALKSVAEGRTVRVAEIG